MIDVYMHTSPSGKRYVGYSTHGTAERWRRHVEFARAVRRAAHERRG